jgi:lipopolysaccharide transport system permease protein
MRFTPSDARAHKQEMKTNLAPTGTGGGRMNRTSLWAQRSLVWQFVVRNVEIRHKGSHLGLVWSVANPLLMLSLYVFVFGFVFGGSFDAIPGETRVDYGLGIFVGLSLFHFVSEVLGQAPTVIVSNPNFVRKVVFPLEILPVATVGASFFHFLVSMALALLGIATIGPGLTWGVLWLPVVFAPVLLWALGVAWMCSALGVFFRDIAQAMQFLTMAVMFASAVFYPASKIPEAAWAVLRFNPLIHAIELSRDAALWNLPLSMTALAYLYATGIAACAGGYFVFRKLRPAFADVV